MKNSRFECRDGKSSSEFILPVRSCPNLELFFALVRESCSSAWAAFRYTSRKRAKFRDVRFELIST